MVSAELVDFSRVRGGSLIDLETKSRHYQIECLGGNKVRISGHPQFCPNPVPAHLHGSFDKEGALELGMIGRGMRAVFLLDDRQPLTTSKVVSVHVDAPGAERKSSPGIH